MTSTRTNDFLLEYKAPDEAWSVVFEDNGQTGYAYLLSAGIICADVWLYNRGEPPTDPPWLHRPSALPFPNTKEHVADAQFDPPTEKSEITVEWAQDLGRAPAAIIRLRGIPIGLLKPDEKPGWAAMAKKVGPLARILTPATLRDVLTPNAQTQCDVIQATEH